MALNLSVQKASNEASENDRAVRLTIARKISLAVIAIVIVCISTMALVTSANLQRGFVAYLNEIQAQDLDALSELLAARYRKEGNFDWLRNQRRALRAVLDQMQTQIQAEPARHPRRNRPPGEGRTHPRAGYGGRASEAENGIAPREDDAAPVQRTDEPQDQRAAERPGQRADGPPSQRADDPPADGPPGARDPMGFAARLSIIDADGRSLIGPPDFPPGIERAIVVDGKTVARMRLTPLRQASGANASAGGFLREQMHQILWLSAAIIVLSTLAAVWLARHLLRPVAALRSVTERLARGQFDARAPVLSRDELAELALHVNAMAAALEASEQQRRKMLADLSHELRTPLTVIRGEIEALLDGIRTADPRALESLHVEVLRLNRLVDDLHQLTLADAGDLHFHWQTLDLNALLVALLERFQARATDAGLSLSWTLPAQSTMVKADHDRLTQVFINLLENSLRYTDRGGRIVVTLAQEAAHAQLSIEDSAPGVPPEAHAQLFERLYRVDHARTRERGGSGLGLAICKALLEAHGAHVCSAPSTLGGIKITIRFPLLNGKES